ncbi:MAG TPA: 30S ribosomal protein S3 [Candidatus Fermentibacter daniensis]|jgi:small subunit ribosomal protein S3|nr:MAG: 30S ribosomal protein S3 [Candidatus Fermentibacter daniensis]MBP7720252.1 30S ribosomal protein S3 [Candidatus Fermentibacter sp.]OQC70833.1 MAG: 30S ribosomal protein S3 [candidate division Hyd24-12 bacterium ADurb.Bin004]KZD16540.1 MAG: 30S ribosomal protein S3 [Candidatus Fermentibacter daniensis]KZD16831.1 MAG: 30S ribosomal protein S3 [Candidatus Fermentibacter daniensis]
MGQKTNPVGLRLGIIRGWNSVWFARGKRYPEYLKEDAMLRQYIMKRLEKAQISKIEIERKPQEVQVTIHTARAGLVIGARGSMIDLLTRELKIYTGKTVRTKVEEIRHPERNASLVADSIARQVESRISIRRAMKRAISDSMKAGAEGIKVCCSGRLGGAEMSRTNTYHEGRVPLHTLRADVDFARSIARTTYGVIGVKVWIYNGEIHDYPGQTGPAE